MSIRPDDLGAEEMEVLKKALSESRVRSGPSAEYAADLRSRLLSVAVAVQPLRSALKSSDCARFTGCGWPFGHRVVCGVVVS